MTDPENLQVENGAEGTEDSAQENAVQENTDQENTNQEGTGQEDTAEEDAGQENTASQSVSVGNGAATVNVPAPGTTVVRNWLLHVPAEIRVIIFGHLLRLPFPISYELPGLLMHRTIRALIGIFHTSRLFYTESINVFLRRNIFFIPAFPTLNAVPSRRLLDMIQNVTITLPLVPRMRESHRRFVQVIRNFGSPAITRNVLSVHFEPYRPYRDTFTRLAFFLRGLPRFTNFRVVEIDIFVPTRRERSTANLCEYVQNALQFVLGPARSFAEGNGLRFFPQIFLDQQPPQEDEDWINNLDGMRLLSDGDETDVDANTDGDETNIDSNSEGGETNVESNANESESPEQDPALQG